MFSEYLGDLPPRLRASEIDSRRFAFPVGRCAIPRSSTASAAEIAREVIASGVDVAIVRAAAERTDLEEGLRTDRRLDVIRADTLRYWRRYVPAPSLGAGATHGDSAPHGDGTVVARDATPADRDGIERVARRAFAGYATHYRANPRFADALIADGFCEWATSGLGRAGATTLVVGGPAGVEGFLLAERDGDALEVVLNAVDPEAEGRGLYTAMLSAAIGRAAREGVREVWISTQAHNERVMRVWERLGFVPEFDLMTLHVMRRA